MLNINRLQECICFDLKIGSKRCAIVSLYRSPSQSADEFENFLNKLNLTIESNAQKNLLLTVIIGDFNARSSKSAVDRHAKNGCSKLKCMSDRDTSKNIASCSLLLNRTCSFHFKCVSIKRFCNEAFVVWLLF